MHIRSYKKDIHNKIQRLLGLCILSLCVCISLYTRIYTILLTATKNYLELMRYQMLSFLPESWQATEKHHPCSPELAILVCLTEKSEMMMWLWLCLGDQGSFDLPNNCSQSQSYHLMMKWGSCQNFFLLWYLWMKKSLYLQGVDIEENIYEITQSKQLDTNLSPYKKSANIQKPQTVPKHL